MSFHKIIFSICFVVSTGLMIGGFFVPPMGIIDGSVLTAAGLLLAFATVAQLPSILHGRSVNLSKGDLSIELGDDDD